MRSGFKFREARSNDIPGMHAVRMSVKENVLNHPALVTNEHYEHYLANGKTWLCEENGTIVGFAVLDTGENNVWALFVHPDYQQKGIGKQLLSMLVEWHFNNKKDALHLNTAAHTRASRFYLMNGWIEDGCTKHGEQKFKLVSEK